MKKLSLIIACAVFSTAMFANNPSPVKDKASKSQIQKLKAQKPVKKTAVTTVTLK